MLINLIVLAVTATLAAVLAVWIRSPALRSALETPKFGIARWDRDDQADVAK